MTHPFVEQGAKKVTPLIRCNAKLHESSITLFVNSSQVTSVGMRLQTLNNRRKLNVVTTYLFKEMVKVERIVSIKVIYYRQSIPFHSMLIEQMNAPHHLVK